MGDQLMPSHILMRDGELEPVDDDGSVGCARVGVAHGTEVKGFGGYMCVCLGNEAS